VDDYAGDKLFVPQSYDVVILESHSKFGASPFTLGLFHPKAPASLCRIIMNKLDEAWKSNIKVVFNIIISIISASL
jgi:hypothetical protein